MSPWNIPTMGARHGVVKWVEEGNDNRHSRTHACNEVEIPAKTAPSQTTVRCSAFSPSTDLAEGVVARGARAVALAQKYFEFCATLARIPASITCVNRQG